MEKRFKDGGTQTSLVKVWLQPKDEEKSVGFPRPEPVPHHQVSKKPPLGLQEPGLESRCALKAGYLCRHEVWSTRCPYWESHIKMVTGSGLPCRVTKRLCSVGTQPRQCTTGCPQTHIHHLLIGKHSETQKRSPLPPAVAFLY